MRREIQELEERLSSLREGTDGAGANGSHSRGRRDSGQSGRDNQLIAARTSAAPAKRRPKQPPSPEIAASWKLQGKYLGLIRLIPKTKRAKYKAIAVEKGREAAITAMRAELKRN
jgi:hypothetical protein